MTVEWFGLPDDLKRHSGQLDYRLKGLSNDQLRQAWMDSTVPLCESLGLKVPAHYDRTTGMYVLDYPFPCAYDPGQKRWLFEDGQITWDDVFQRWKSRGPMNEAYVESLRVSRAQVGRWLGGAA